MADLATLRNSVRMRVHDYGRTPSVYADAVYNNAISVEALDRVNLDLGTAYSLTSLPQKYELLVRLQASIFMCQVRGGEGASSDVDDPPPPVLQTMVVPSMTVTEVNKAREGPMYWNKLAAQLSKDYEDALDKLKQTDADAGGVFQITLNRTDRLRGNRVNYAIDYPPEQPTVAGGVAAGTVTITWGMLFDPHFDRYEVRRSTSASMTGAKTVATFVDNHEVECQDNPGAGVWYYRVRHYNRNDLYSDSAVVTVTVT